MPETSIYLVTDLAGAPEQVSSSIWLLSGFPNIVFVVGDHATLVVDTGLGDGNGAVAFQHAQQLSRGGKFFVTTTHFHPEHAAGIGGFPATAVLIRPRIQQDEMDERGEAILAAFRESPRFAPPLAQTGSPRPADLTFEREARLDLGGVNVRLMYLGAGHTVGDELIYVEQDRALISGDIVQKKVVPFVSAPGASYASWLAVLDELSSLQPALIIPTHSPVGDASLISELTGFIIDMRDRMAALKSAGLSAENASARLAEDFGQHYPEWAANPDWRNMVTLQSLASRLYEEIQPGRPAKSRPGWT
jgi:glyoxylase-like metal-dependent hydrolase (beta-lactamase superfamily II)